jgi:hypothetical protein
MKRNETKRHAATLRLILVLLLASVSRADPIETYLALGDSSHSV